MSYVFTPTHESLIDAIEHSFSSVRCCPNSSIHTGCWWYLSPIFKESFILKGRLQLFTQHWRPSAHKTYWWMKHIEKIFSHNLQYTCTTDSWRFLQSELASCNGFELQQTKSAFVHSNSHWDIQSDNPQDNKDHYSSVFKAQFFHHLKKHTWCYFTTRVIVLTTLITRTFFHVSCSTFNFNFLLNLCKVRQSPAKLL